MALRDDLLASLVADAPLMALLTGGAHTGTTIDRQNTPAAFNANREILPCALLRLPLDAPAGPRDMAGRQIVEVYFYQRIGYATIDQARARLFTIWQNKRLAAGMWEILWADDMADQWDDALNCALAVSRYAAYRAR